MKRVLLFVFIGCLALLAVYQRAETTGAAEQKPQVGFSAPHFSLKAMDGATYKLEGAREKPLVINFWASWCGPCQQEAPDLRDVYLKYKGQIDLYAVNLTKDDDRESARQFVQRFQLPFPVLLDETGAVGNRYRVQGIPTTFFVDRRGVIRQISLGMLDAATLERQVKALLALQD